VSVCTYVYFLCRQRIFHQYSCTQTDRQTDRQTHAHTHKASARPSSTSDTLATRSMYVYIYIHIYIYIHTKECMHVQTNAYLQMFDKLVHISSKFSGCDPLHDISVCTCIYIYSTYTNPNFLCKLQPVGTDSRMARAEIASFRFLHCTVKNCLVTSCLVKDVGVCIHNRHTKGGCTGMHIGFMHAASA